MEYYKYLRQYVGHKPLILPGSVVIIVNRQGEILLQKRHDGTWALPGGLMDLGESFEEVARREVFEETGLVISDMELVNVFSGSDYYLKVPNGDELYSVTAVYATRDVSGDIQVDYNESQALQYFAPAYFPERLTEGYRRFVQVYLDKNARG